MIGSVADSSGLGSAGYDQVGDALRAWAAVTNAKGGIDGRPVKVIIKDPGGDAAKARSQAQELVEKHKVVALVANDGWTSSVNAWKDYAEKKKVPAIGGNCYATVWETSPTFFSQCPSFDAQLYGSVFLAAKHGQGTKFGGLFCSEDAVCTTAKDRWFGQGYAKRAGLDPVYQADVSLSQPDYTSECIQARNAGVEILALATDSATTKRIASSCRRQNFTPEYLISTSVAEPDQAKFIDEIISAQQAIPFSGTSTPAYQEFAAAWEKHYQEPPNPLAVNSWAAAKIFEKAVRSAKEITRSGLIDALYRFKKERFGGLTVPLSYGPKGTDSVDCVFYMKASGGNWSAPQGDRPVCW
ncbi:ABC transporter substrate-binding protein [Haloechinothrix salitolerans]|uniref:ABC transporter substrate-binding protein n=1 Tax=Haloechinothrix salitolerans TaxID=926830 RepID=A0ABW2C1D4_9PSEU